MRESIPEGTVIGEFVVSSLLGAGGMGEVYRARDPRLGRDVAIKLLPKSVTSDADRLRRFEQEARSAAALNHPNILAIYQMGVFEGLPYLVTELLEGETVREHLKRSRFPVHKAIAYSVQVTNGLAAAHEKGIIHRDIKPDNLFITKDGRLKILDFGLATLARTTAAGASNDETVQTDPGILVGTVGYMSPEQVRGEPVDNRSDIFSLGAVLCEMVTGKQAFQKGSSVETMSAILNEEPPSLAESDSGVPPALRRIVRRCLEKSPQQRFQSASDLAFALEAVESSGEPAATRSTRLRVSLAAVALVVVLSAMLVGFLATRTSPVPVVSSYVQLTHDGQQKNLLGTDGARLYLALASSGVQEVAALPIAGGEPRALPLTISSNMFPLALSADGAEVLLVDGQGIPPLGPLWSAPLLGGSPRRLGNLSGTDGAWSPDGSKLAYSDGSSLYLANGDGSDPQKLLTLKNLIMDPVWSPDGKRVRFDTPNDPGSIMGQHVAWEVNANGGNPHRLFEGWHNPPDECCGQWTADGKFFIFESRGQIWAVPEEGRWIGSSPEPVQLTASPMSLYSPFPSKDGKKLFVVGRTYRGRLERFDMVSKTFVPFLGGISAEYPAFSKDGKWVAYTSYPEGNIWKSRVDGSERVQLTFSPLYSVMPRWSPDGTKIVFFKFPEGAKKPASMFEMSAKGGSPRQLLPNDPHNQQDPTWSPDGKKIAFAGDLNDVAAADTATGIRVLELKTNVVSILPDSERLFSPRWSPDGRYIAALSGDSKAIMLFDIQTQKWSNILNGSVGWLNWSSDAQYIYFLEFEGRGGVSRVRVRDRQREKVVDLKVFVTTGRYGGSLAIAPDGSPLLLRDTGTQDIYALDWKTP